MNFQSNTQKITTIPFLKTLSRGRLKTSQLVFTFGNAVILHNEKVPPNKRSGIVIFQFFSHDIVPIFFHIEIYSAFSCRVFCARNSIEKRKREKKEGKKMRRILPDFQLTDNFHEQTSSMFDVSRDEKLYVRNELLANC